MRNYLTKIGKGMRKGLIGMSLGAAGLASVLSGDSYAELPAKMGWHNIYVGTNGAERDFPRQEIDFTYTDFGTAWNEHSTTPDVGVEPGFSYGAKFFLGDVEHTTIDSTYNHCRIYIKGVSRERSKLNTNFSNYGYLMLENLGLDGALGSAGVVGFQNGSFGGVNNCDLYASIKFNQSDDVSITNNNFDINHPYPDDHAIGIVGPISKQDELATKVSFYENSVVVRGDGGRAIELVGNAKLEAGLENIFGENYFEADILVRTSPDTSTDNNVIGNAVVDVRAMKAMGLKVSADKTQNIYVTEPDDLIDRYIVNMGSATFQIDHLLDYNPLAEGPWEGPEVPTTSALGLGGLAGILAGVGASWGLRRRKR
jgi:hypothetical protein